MSLLAYLFGKKEPIHISKIHVGDRIAEDYNLGGGIILNKGQKLSFPDVNGIIRMSDFCDKEEILIYTFKKRK